jgi:hypothetical protein
VTFTYSDLIAVRLGNLGAAVSDWRTTVHNLKTLASDAQTGMKAKADKARWAGANATVTRNFVDRTAKEFNDLHAEADSICRVLEDAYTDLVKIQTSVRTAVAVDATRLGVTVQDIGGGKVRCFFPHVRGDTDQRTQDELDARQELEERINRHLARAAEIDASAARALGRSTGDDAHNAGHSTYASLNDAQAERALELAKKGAGMSDKELAELNQLIEGNGTEKDGEFATRFYQGLGGPEKTLEFYAEMSIDGTGADATKTRLAAVAELQRNMGNALGVATDPDSARHLPGSWGAEFRKLGTQPIGAGPYEMNRPFGYQVLGGLLRYGTYDPRFLDPIAEHVTQLHKEDPSTFSGNAPMGSEDIYGFNPSGKLGSGNDPLNSVLEALGHSPEASERFFTDPPTAYNEDGTVKSGGSVGFGSYLDLFTDEDFDWTADTNDSNLVADEDKTKTALTYGPQALGHALESATTGRAYDSDDMSAAISHSPERAELVVKIVDKFGTHPELIRHNENGEMDGSGPLYGMRESLGDITAEYMADFQRALAQTDNDLFSSFGTSADLRADTTQRFLAEVGQDPGAYASITSAQQAYTANVVNEVLNGDSNSTVADAGRLGNATHPGAIIAGIMSESRADAVLDYHSAADKEFNEAASDKQKWADRILSVGVDNTVGKVPILGDVVGWASSDIQDSIMKSIEQDSADQAEAEAGDTYGEGRSAVMASARAAVVAAARNGDFSSDTIQDLCDSAGYGADNGFSVGSGMKRAGDAS